MKRFWTDRALKTYNAAASNAKNTMPKTLSRFFYNLKTRKKNLFCTVLIVNARTGDGIGLPLDHQKSVAGRPRRVTTPKTRRRMPQKVLVGFFFKNTKDC